MDKDIQTAKSDISRLDALKIHYEFTMLAR